MELRELISFYHVARLRSVSKAAKKLELGQPTVTTHLRKLEDEFGVVLFDRIKRPIQLTTDGATFFELARPIVEAIDALKSQMDYSERRGSFIVGAYPDLVLHHLPKAVQSFRNRYPDVRIRLLARLYVTLIQLVKSGEVDLALCTRPPSDDASLEFEELFSYNITLLTPRDHPLLDRHPIQLQDVARWPLILFGPESNTRQRVEQALKEQGISYDVALEVDNTELIKRYVEIGMGVAVSTDFTLQPDDHEKLGVVRLNHLFPSGVIGVCTLRGKFLGRSVRNFIDTLMEELRGYQVPQGSWDTVGEEPSKLATVGSND